MAVYRRKMLARRARLTAAALATLALCNPTAAYTPPVAYVFFESGSAKVDPKTNPILEQFVIEAYQQGFIERLAVVGHADRVGTEPANLALSRRRAVAVRDFLIVHGIEPAAIMCGKWYGELRPMIRTADGVAEANNRRVEVVWGNALPSDCEFVHQPF
ncbi:OmpA family protein [Enterovirga sp. GCM10030262]|uniref:OmpA family protein n=1 Tax=Enterovirga sp. GCM10030262 TaxID=3273391 RepID=UPI0036131638